MSPFTIGEILIWLLLTALLFAIIGWLLAWLWMGRKMNTINSAIHEELTVRNTRITKLSNSLNSRQAEIDKSVKLRADAEGKLAEVSGKYERVRAAADMAADEIEARNVEIASLKAELAAAKADTTALSERDAEIAQLRADFATADSERAKHLGEVKALTSKVAQLTPLTTVVSEHNVEVDELKAHIGDLEAQIGDLKVKANHSAEMDTELNGLRAQIGDLQARIVQADQCIVTQRGDLKAKADLVAQRDNEIEDLQARIDSLSAAAAVTVDCDHDDEEPSVEEAKVRVAEIAARTAGTGPRQVDELPKVKGIGPVINEILHSLDITSFAQIARFDDDDIKYVGAALEVFPGRIQRDGWIGQARRLHQEKYGNDPLES